MASATMPSINRLGRDLLVVSPAQRIWSILRPLLCVAGYFVFAFNGWWIPAILAVAGLMFIVNACGRAIPLTFGESIHHIYA
jgi:hypothetical protein